MAWSLFGRRAGLIAAVLFALNPFLTAYSQETRMYTLMTLLGLLATAGFIHGFIYRRRTYLVLFVVCQALMLYTHAWGIFFGVGAALALVPVWRVSEDRRALLRDALLCFGAAAVLYLPWLPTLLYQATHTGSPWDSAPNFGAPVQISRNLMGGDRATTALVLGAAIGLAVPVGPKPAALGRGDVDVGADADPDRDAGLRLDRVALLAGVAVPLLRPDPRRAAAARRVRPGARQGRGADRARAGRDLLGQSEVLHAAVQERHARRRRRARAASCTPATWWSSASPSRCR